MCDQISDAILDAHLKQDPDAKVACETVTKTGMIMVCGEITSKVINYYFNIWNLQSSQFIINFWRNLVFSGQRWLPEGCEGHREAYRLRWQQQR